MASDRAAALAEQLSGISKEIQSDPSLGAAIASDVGRRVEILEAARSIVYHARQSADFFIDHATHLTELSAVRLFIEWKVFEQIPDDKPITFSALASKVGADAVLISRFGGLLAATGILKQAGPDRVTHSAQSKALAATPPYAQAMVKLLFDSQLFTAATMPAYFKKYGLKEPQSRYGTIAAVAAGSPESTVWDIMNRDHDQMFSFMLCMEALDHSYPIVGSYDFGWAVAAAAADPDRAIVVDVGGGKGHALKEICRKTPGLTIDRCVLEDMPDVLDETKNLEDAELKGVQMAPLDFHEEQPIKGALIYYIRRCLHDYGDEEAVTMLRRLSDAMASDSRLLIVEQVIGAPPAVFSAVADTLLMLQGGKERNLATFRELASKANLSIREVYRTAGVDAAVIECVKI